MESVEYNLERTSLNHVPRMFKVIEWNPGSINLDIGGGRFDTATNYLKEKGVTNIILDPYSRTEDENLKAIDSLQNQLVDTVTICNVLCVVEDAEDRIEILELASDWIKDSGRVYISIYPGDGSGKGKRTQNNTWQNNRGIKTYMDEILKVFNSVELVNNYLICKK